MSDGDRELHKSSEQSAAASLSPQHMRLTGTSSSLNALESCPIAARTLGSLSALSESASQTAAAPLWARELDRDPVDVIGAPSKQRGQRVRAGSGGVGVSTISGRPGGAVPRGALASGEVSEASAGEELAEARVLSSLANVKQAIYGGPEGYVAGVDPIAMPSASAGMRQASRSMSDMSTLGFASSTGPGSGGFKSTNWSSTAGSRLRIGPTGTGSSVQGRQAASDVQKIGKLPTYMSKWDSKFVKYVGRPPNSPGSRTVASATSTTTSATTSDSCCTRMATSTIMAPVSALTSNLSAMTSSGSTLHIGLYKKKAIARPATLETEKQGGGGGGGRGGLGAGAGEGRSLPSPDSPKPVLTSSAATLHHPRSPTTASSGGSGSIPVAAQEVPVKSANEWTATPTRAPTRDPTQTQAQAVERKPSAPPKAAVTPAIRLPAAPCQRSTLSTSAAFQNANANEARAESCSTNNNKSNMSATSCSTQQQTHAIAVQSIGSIGSDRPKASASASPPPLVSPSAAGATAGMSASQCDTTLSVRASDRGRTAGRSMAPVEKAKKRAKHSSKEKELPPARVPLQNERQSSTSTSSSTSTFKPPAVPPQRTGTNPAGASSGPLAWWRFIGAGVTRTSSVKDVRRDVKVEKDVEDGGREAAGGAGGDCGKDEAQHEGQDELDGEEARDAVDGLRASLVDVVGLRPSTSSLGHRLSSSLSNLAAASPTTPASRLPSTLYASTYTGAKGGGRKPSGTSGQTGKPASARQKTAQLNLNIQQKREHVLTEMKKVDAHLVASVRQKQALLEALHRRTHCEHQHEHSTEGSTLSSSTTGPPSPAVTTNQRTSPIPTILTTSITSTISTTTTLTSTKPKASATGRVAAGAAFERSALLRLADHMLKQLHGMLDLYQRRLVQPNVSAKSNTAAVQMGADIINEINTQLRAFENLLRRVAPSAAPVEMVAKAKSLLEEDLKEQLAASVYLPRRPSVLSSRVFNFGGGGGGGGGPSNAGAGSVASTAPSPSPSPSPLTNRPDEAPVSGPKPLQNATALHSKAAGEALLNTAPSNPEDGNNTEYDEPPDEPLPPPSRARPLSSSDQNGAKRTGSSSNKSAASGVVPVAPAATITKSDASESGGLCASSVSSQNNSERTSTAAAAGSLQSFDSCQQLPQPQQQVQSQPAGKTPAQSSASKESAAATDKRSVIMKIMGQRMGLTRVRVHKPSAQKDSQRISNVNSSSSIATNTIKPAGRGSSSNSSSSSFKLTSSNATSAELRAAASPLRIGPESTLKDLHV